MELFSWPKVTEGLWRTPDLTGEKCPILGTGGKKPHLTYCNLWSPSGTATPVLRALMYDSAQTWLVESSGLDVGNPQQSF